MTNADDLTRLAGVVATRMSGLLTGGSAGSTPGAGLSALLDALELFVPQVLREDFQEWEVESLDGFFVAEAKKETEDSVSLVGLAILISDQTVTPFCVCLRSTGDGSLERAEVLLGERGGGALGISGPDCTSASVSSRLESLLPRLSQIDWVYRATYTRPVKRPPDGS